MEDPLEGDMDMSEILECDVTVKEEIKEEVEDDSYDQDNALPEQVTIKQENSEYLGKKQKKTLHLSVCLFVCLFLTSSFELKFLGKILLGFCLKKMCTRTVFAKNRNKLF